MNTKIKKVEKERDWILKKSFLNSNINVRNQINNN